MADESRAVQPPVPLDTMGALHHLVALMLGAKPLAELVHDICLLAATSIRDVDEVSIVLIDDDRTQTAAFSGSLAATLDERQYDSGFGPGLDAARARSVIRVDDTTSSGEYPDFAAIAGRQGVTSVLAIGLPASAQIHGGLTLYRLRGTQPFSPQTEAAASTFVTYAAATLANAALLASRERRATHLHTALAGRAVIDQAKGIVMRLVGCEADEAFLLLTKRSQRANRKLRDVAAELVADAVRGEDPRLP
ncbi:GAF and ANTAR domain-containing protein [Kineococcus rubinsiae]|uniref:GAF and ANTAR domain-containing protein n=1 Tax=Kineococcus rubinsiae TaxID=2609562 RepID=UPI0014305E30|nr:ANTAR domain-containing protein [Kineococcus rubinsiae]NIZ89653.1 ANTAR domain-containing protein [Kineococcus rubinsiae]